MWHVKLGMWLPPGGHCEPNEDPVQAAIREAKEETGLDVRIIPPPGLLDVERPQVLPPPEVILIEDIVRADQPFHQHIDHVYITEAVGAVDFDAPIPGGVHAWFDESGLAPGIALETPMGDHVPIAEDVRLLGIRALHAARRKEPQC
jgi:8-oxo-dGTP pyrophosphatase MutT (NUDIX family)